MVESRTTGDKTPAGPGEKWAGDTNVPRTLFLAALESHLRGLGPLPKAYASFLSSTREHVEADGVRLYGMSASAVIEERWSCGSEVQLDEDAVLAFARQERPHLPMNVLLSPVRVHDRLVAVLAAGRTSADFPLGSGRRLNRLAWVLAKELARREEERLTRVLDRIKEKVVSELRPRDLEYLILDGLFELVQYDHSASLLTYDPSQRVFRVEAEKIAWTKAKSSFVGHEIPVSDEVVDALERGGTAVVVATEGSALYPLVGYHRGHGTPAPSAFLCAPVFFKDELLGVVRMAAWKRPPFDGKDIDVVERFLPAAAASLKNVRVKLSLERQAMEAELRASLVTLARAVAHDVNNAIGAILPLAEQARDDLKEGHVDRDNLIRDLDAILEKAILCKRIFLNMLKAGSERAGSAPVDLNQLVRELEPMLEAQVGPRRIALELELDEGLPLVRFSRPHLERVVWNLVTNAIEAVAPGGRIAIRTRDDSEDGTSLSVSDDGPGIPPEILTRVQEPFFTTKPNGTGLGLAICRALAWQYGGSLTIDSVPGRGTTVSLRLSGVEP